MKLKYLYLILSIMGLAFPMSQFILFTMKYGMNMRYFLELSVANSVSRMFTLDLVIASLAFFLLVLIEGRRKEMKNLWAYFLFTLGIGLSFAFPLFLYIRERKLESK